MENQEYIVPDDIKFQSFNDITSNSTIKREDMKDDYDIFLFAHLDNITNNLAASANDLPLGQDVDIPPQIQEATSSTLQNNINNVKDEVSLQLENMTFLKDQLPDANNTSHFVRYKLQDGKHVKMWECGICQKVFTHQYTLMRHLPTHTDERKFQCITCGKAFRQMSTLSQHRAIHSTERPYVCEICQKTFNRVSTLISHRKTHTGLKPHRCHLCTKSFHQKGNLRNHIFTHTNERPYMCDICEKGFNQMSNLMCHKLKVHQRTEKPKYICQVCGKCFPKRISLRQHEQYSHKMVTPALTPVADKQQIDETNYADAIIVDPIKTEAMKHAIESNQTPFALLRPVTGIPVLVRVLPAGDKQMLVPASAEDLKKHSHISIKSKSDKAVPETVKEEGEQAGNMVQIKIPVVATVIQQHGPAGQMSMSVVSPGPNGELGDQSGSIASKISNFIYSSTLTNCRVDASSEQMNHGNIPVVTDDFTKTGILEDVNIEFLDEHGRKLEETYLTNELTEAYTNAMIYQEQDVNNITNIGAPDPVITDLQSSDLNFSDALNMSFFDNVVSFPLV